MAKISFVYPIEEIIGKLKEKFGAGRHKSANAKGLHNQWTINYGTRDLTNKPLSDAEIAARDKFTAVRAAVLARKGNPTKRVQDQNAFKAQSVYKTMNAYLWSVCGAEYDAAHTEE